MLFETIKIKNSRVYNMPWHQKRIDYSLKRFNLKPLDLMRIKLDSSKNSRAKIIYKNSFCVEQSDLISRDIKRLKLIRSDASYCFKFTDRSHLDTIYNMRSHCDDCLIIKNSLVTDTTIANIAFFDGANWITPRVPLLKGTMRARLLDGKFLKPATIKPQNLDRFWLVSLINSVIGFRVIGSVHEILEGYE